MWQVLYFIYVFYTMFFGFVHVNMIVVFTLKYPVSSSYLILVIMVAELAMSVMSIKIKKMDLL